MFEEKPKTPIGEAKKIAEMISENWREHLLLFSQVKNEVLEVNPAFKKTLPLKLEEGKSTPLGFFVEAAFKEKPGYLPEGKQALEFWPRHHRSITLGRVIFEDDDGNIYRDIDLKGVGSFIKPSGDKKIKIVKLGEKRDDSGRMGLLDEDIARFDYQMSEEFLKAGVRACRVIGIIKLEEIISGGEKISLEKAKNLGLIDENFHPVVEIRGYATKFRLGDILQIDEDRKNLIIGDAKKIISQELGIKEFDSDYDYLKWFAETLGRNIGLMHKNSWLHNYISTHNITLDCKIVDFDSLSQLTNEEERQKETTSALASLFAMVKELSLLETTEGGMEYLEELFHKNYDSAFPQEERDDYFKMRV